MEKEKSKKWLIYLVLIVFILTVGIVLYVICKKTINNDVTDGNNVESTDISNNNYNDNDNDYILDQSYTTTYIYVSDRDDSIIKFYKYDETKKKYKYVREYVCDSKGCYLGAGYQGFHYHFDYKNGKGIITDNNTHILYDVEKGILGKYMMPAYQLCDDYSCTTDTTFYLFMKSIDNGMYGIIDLDGNIIKDFKLDKPYSIMGMIMYNTYSIEKNMFVDKLNNKAGIIEITSDKVIVGYNYDDIRLLNSDKYFEAKLNDKWYLYSYDKEEQKNNEGYDNLIFVNDDIILAQIDNYLYIKDINGNNLVNDKIEVLSEYVEYACCDNHHGIEYEINDDLLMIYIYKERTSKEKITYEYNINSKELIKK